MSTHTAKEISEDEWIRLFKKRSYYAQEIAELILNLPPEQARAAKEKVFEIQADFSKFQAGLEAMGEIPSFNRLAILMNKFDEHLCCYSCAFSTLIGAFLKTKCDAEVENPILH